MGLDGSIPSNMDIAGVDGTGGNYGSIETILDKESKRVIDKTIDPKSIPLYVFNGCLVWNQFDTGRGYIHRIHAVTTLDNESNFDKIFDYLKKNSGTFGWLSKFWDEEQKKEVVCLEGLRTYIKQQRGLMDYIQKELVLRSYIQRNFPSFFTQKKAELV